MTDSATVIRPGDGEVLNVGPSSIALKATGENTGAGGPPSVGWNFTLTFIPMESPSGATSTKLVKTAGPSSSVT